MGRGVGLISALVAVLAFPSAAAGAPIRTGFGDPVYFAESGGQQAASFDRARQAGGSVARLNLRWRSAAPTRPADPSSPFDPAYNWAWFDRQVQLAAASGLQPMATILLAPSWAEGAGPGPNGTVKPSPAEFGRFARAAALRYSGLFPGLPRIRYWQAWNEPNRDYFLMPQVARGRIVSAPWYRSMVRAFAAGVHGVHASNVVVAGGLAPLGRAGKPAPLAFMRKLFCLTKALKRACNLRSARVPFDAWAHHPYTSGGPTHRAPGKDDVALGDLGKMKRVLRAAVRLGHVRSRARVSFWVTEFSWDSRPPDPQGLPSSLHARWTAEALYRMWRHGVSVVTWFRIMDDPMSTSYYQSGFFTVDGRAKRSLTAFRFPVVAFARRGGIYVWARTPYGQRGRLVLSVRSGSSWRLLGTVSTSPHGIISRTFRTKIRSGSVRGRFAGETSLPFSLAYARDRFVNPFGCGGPIAC